MNAMAPVSAGAILHAGCGTEPLPEWISGTETRLDIDGRLKPDIQASMTNMGDIGPFDLVYCSHALEHLQAADMMEALHEFKRVLKPDGRAIVIVPDLEDVKPTFDVVYTSPAGPITGFAMYYGDPRVAAGNPFMTHKCGFVRATLEEAFAAAGFPSSTIIRDPVGFNLVGIGHK